MEERDPTKNTSQQNRRDDKEGQPSYDHTRGGFRGEQRSGPSSRPMDLRPKSVENDRTLASDKVPNEEKDRRRQAGLCIKFGKGPHRMEECKTGWFYRARRLGTVPPPPSPQRKSLQIRTSYKPPPHTKYVHVHRLSASFL